MRSILNEQRKVGDILRDIFNLNWVFERWYEKLFLTILCLLGIWKIINFFG